MQIAPDADYLREIQALGQEFFAWPGASPENADKLWQQVKNASPALITAISEDQARLFSGPMPLAPPWESVWLEKDRLLFGERTKEVEAIYADWGVEHEKRLNEPGDHLGLELGFLLYLLALESRGHAQKSLSGKSLKDAQKQILQEHILLFAPQMLKKAAESANTEFYRKACLNTLHMLPELAKAILGSQTFE